ncbi:poly(ADP-ribose) polymerase family member 14-related sequence 1 [Scyliorhinus torazame]
MAAEADYPYPLLIEGDWGPDIAKLLKTKLQLYFQSKKKSNGGDCVVEYDDLLKTQAVVRFACQQTRCSVLEKEAHELDLQKRGKVHLTVRPLPQAAAGGNRTAAAQQTPEQYDLNSMRKRPKTEQGELAEQNLSEEQKTLTVTLPSDDISNEHVQKYFESGISGGGPLMSFVREGREITLTFENAEDAEAVLNQQAHSVKNVQLMVRRFHDEKTKAPPQSSAVVLQNLPENASCEMLNLLIENYTGLSEIPDNFSVEILSERNVGVVTFKADVDITEFIKKCSRKVWSNAQNVVAKKLEVTISVRVENLPPHVSEDLLKLYFENPKNGFGNVTAIEIIPEDNVAIVSFENSEVLDTILANTHMINKTPIHVYPYYKSLGSALYGNKRPVVKVPDPFTFDIDPFILKFIKSDRQRIAEIVDKMSLHHCKTALPESGLSNSIKISPAFSRQERSFEKLVKNWKKEAAGNLTGILLKYKTVENHVSQQIWEIIRRDLDPHLSQNVAVLPDISKGKVIVTGESDSVDTLQRTFKSIMDSATEKLEREKQSVTETVICNLAVRNLLLCTGLEKHISTVFPNLSMQFNSNTSHITLHGLPSDVYPAKSRILEIIVQMKQKQIDMNPHLISFLQILDANEVSCCLFISNGINAVYNIKDNCVLLVGDTDHSLLTAERQIKKHLYFECIEIEDQNVIRMREWAQLKEKLDRKLNSSSKQVEMNEIPLDGHMQAIITGYSDAVAEVFEMLSDFVKKNTIIQRLVLFKSGGVLQFLMGVMKIDVFDAPPKGVKIKVNNMANGVFVSGPQENICQVEKLLLDAASTVVNSVLNITKPATKKIFKEKEDMYVTTVMHKFNCVLKTIEHGVLGDDGESSQGSCKVQLPGGTLVIVYRGDLCKNQVDVIVNAANEDLKHIGGLAGALLKSAGTSLQNECNWIVNKQGALSPGDAVITDAGNLPCSKVIHAVGPRWMETDADTAKKRLRKAVLQSLYLAESHNLKTIAIPAISSGIFGFPLPLCAEVIVRSIREHCIDLHGGSKLKEIHLVNNDEKTVHAVSVAVQKILGEFSLHTPVQPERLNIDSRIKSRNMSCLHKAQTKEGLNIIVDRGNIQDVTADVIVNVIGMDFDLSSGAVSQALLQKAGPKLQQLLFNEKHTKKHAIGKIYETKGCNLNCEQVFHVIAPSWDQGKRDAEKLLRNIIKDCLKNTEGLQLNSIAFPVIGTGKLLFPKDLVASLMFEKVLKFSSKRSTKNLKNVHFVVHPDDGPTLQAMSGEFKRIFLSQPRMTHPAAQQGPSVFLFGRVSSTAAGHVEVQVGPILLQVVTGDITKETTDVIVNSTNNNFTLHAGVSKAILDAAGLTVVNECQKLGSQPNNGIIITNPGNLQCQKIIHMVGQTDPNQIKAFVGTILQTCENSKFSSVAFPALGTGQGKVNPSQVADAMIDSVSDLVNRKSPTSLQKIRIVIFQPHMFNEFHSCVQKRERSNLPETESLWNKAKNAVTGLFFGDSSKEKKQYVTEDHIVLEDQIEPVLFEICGGTKQTVENAKTWIENLIAAEHDEKVISSEYIFQFSEKEQEELRTLQRDLQIVLELERKQSGSWIKVYGAAKDVSNAYSIIQEMVNNLRRKELRRRDEELLSNLLEWQFEQGTQFIPFDSPANFMLEKAFKEQRTGLVIELQNRKCTVDLKKEIAVDNQGNSIKLKRVSKTEGSSLDNIPRHWDNMQKSQHKSVQLSKQSLEYQDVEKSVRNSTNQFQIVKIERLQNPFLWKNYMIRKQLLEEKNPAGTTNEMILFHGTAQDTLDSISHLGFNRSYAGRNATAYGNGTYFAVHANYSAGGTYARVDANGFKHMYRARVLTGVFCRGAAGMVTPPAKNPANPTDLYDSVVDNVQAPSMFIIFNDIQAYPEYLITFR